MWGSTFIIDRKSTTVKHEAQYAPDIQYYDYIKTEICFLTSAFRSARIVA